MVLQYFVRHLISFYRSNIVKVGGIYNWSVFTIAWTQPTWVF